MRNKSAGFIWRLKTTLKNRYLFLRKIQVQQNLLPSVAIFWVLVHCNHSVRLTLLSWLASQYRKNFRPHFFRFLFIVATSERKIFHSFLSNACWSKSIRENCTYKLYLEFEKSFWENENLPYSYSCLNYESLAKQFARFHLNRESEVLQQQKTSHWWTKIPEKKTLHLMTNKIE